jgi:SAM-dependent methyltransferase
MSVTMPSEESPTPAQAVFDLPAAAHAPRRPRLVSYIGRWGRARRWLPPKALRILDVGCCWGYGCAAILARGPADRVVVGVEYDREYLEYGRSRFPLLTLLEGDASTLPIPDESVDAVLFLDVLEHLTSPESAITEARRVLRRDGVVIASVPHRGTLHWLDALNIYRALRRRRPSLPPLEPITESGGGPHRHFTVAELEELLGSSLVIDRVARTGLGLAELLYLPMLLVRAPLRAHRVPPVLQLVYHLAYLVEDLIPAGRHGYHLTIRARVATDSAS